MAKSVLKHQLGGEVKLSEADSERLSSAFFTEIESKYRERYPALGAEGTA
jgi:hypothetical protein